MPNNPLVLQRPPGIVYSNKVVNLYLNPKLYCFISLFKKREAKRAIKRVIRTVLIGRIIAKRT